MISKLKTVSAQPLYLQLMDKIKEDISTGKYPFGSKIPTELELKQEFNISLGTIRRAVEELTKQGIVQKIQGKGTFVQFPHNENFSIRPYEFYDSLKKVSKNITLETINVQTTEATSKDIIDLQLNNKKATILEAFRLIRSDGTPLILERICFPISFNTLEEEDINRPLYQTMNKFNMETTQVFKDISLCFASDLQAEYLAVPPGTPLMKLYELVVNQYGKPVYSNTRLIRNDGTPFSL